MKCSRNSWIAASIIPDAERGLTAEDGKLCSWVTTREGNTVFYRFSLVAVVSTRNAMARSMNGPASTILRIECPVNGT